MREREKENTQAQLFKTPDNVNFIVVGELVCILTLDPPVGE